MQYFSNREYNSCWGRKIVITKDGKLKPYIHSEIILGELGGSGISYIFEELIKYRDITKDKVKICKDCELRYVCFDCREIAMRESNGDLYATNPHCKYDPYRGNGNIAAIFRNRISLIINGTGKSVVFLIKYCLNHDI